MLDVAGWQLPRTEARVAALVLSRRADAGREGGPVGMNPGRHSCQHHTDTAYSPAAALPESSPSTSFGAVAEVQVLRAR